MITRFVNGFDALCPHIDESHPIFQSMTGGESVASVDVAREWPLIGRAEELGFVDSAMRRRDVAGGVVLVGGAGVGKTRLAREAVALARGRGARVWWVAATECARAVPLGAFAEMLPEPGDPHTVVRRTLDRIAGGRSPVVVAVDDAHLLDDLSALVVNQLVLQQRATVLATVRIGERAPDAVIALWKDELLQRMDLQPLSERETEALVEAALGGSVEGATTRRLWRLSRGNALFLRQLVVPGAFRCEGGVWRLEGEVEVPPILSEMVDARISALPVDVRMVIDLLALSEPLPVGLLDEAVERGAVERAEDAGLVSIDTNADRWEARLVHPLYGEVRRAGIGLLRARRLCGEIAMALADIDSRPDAAARRALLLLDSDLPADVSLFVRVGEQALGLSDVRLADRLGRAAVAAGGGFRAQAIVAYAAIWPGMPEAADVELARLAELATDEGQFVRATIMRATGLAYMMAHPDQALTLLDNGAVQVADRPLRDALRAVHAMTDSSTGRLDAARVVATEILTSDHPDDIAVLFSACALVIWAAVTGCADLAAYAARGMTVCDKVAEFANLRVPLISQYVSGLVWSGHLDRASAAAAGYRDAVEDAPFTESSLIVGIALLARGELALARNLLRQECVRFAPLGRSAGGAYFGALTTLTPCLAVLGELEAAREAQAEMRRYRTPAVTFYEPVELLADAWVAAVEGNISTAITLAQESAAIARRHGQHMHTVMALHTATRFGDRTTATELAELATRVDGPRAPAAAAHAAALAADDGAALNAAVVAFERMGDRLSAADVAAQAAVSFFQHGRKGSGNLAAARALRLAADCGGAHSPALALVASPLPLSVREREIVTLAAEGLTNQQIADRLTVSRRTVEGHLYRASTKLGVTSRHDFSTILGLAAD
ncbi:regulatory LuxR family protein [Nocardia tenerifensis]|uniref:Regulatory LuxR family protein n=1 Tax=Nocardia tenerifensis TaxID=228006 RepID=A0A318K8Q8_9NOCA|nr:regulatory LuxR family protein [Nocardia tenerifensis]